MAITPAGRMIDCSTVGLIRVSDSSIAPASRPADRAAGPAHVSGGGTSAARQVGGRAAGSVANRGGGDGPGPGRRWYDRPTAPPAAFAYPPLHRDRTPRDESAPRLRLPDRGRRDGGPDRDHLLRPADVRRPTL